MSRFMKASRIYHAKQVYDDDFPEFKFYKPEFTGNFAVVDCFVLDEHGNRHPHYTGGSVPIHTRMIGKEVR